MPTWMSIWHPCWPVSESFAIARGIGVGKRCRMAICPGRGRRWLQVSAHSGSPLRRICFPRAQIVSSLRGRRGEYPATALASVSRAIRCPVDRVPNRASWSKLQSAHRFGRIVSMNSIGPYRLDAEIGHGAMGIVFRGFDPAIGRPVAIKIIQLNQFASATEKAELKLRFAREAAAAGKLSHPNIVAVHHLGEQDDLQYIVLELVEGASLEKILSDGRPEERGSTVALLQQMADALDYAHSQGVVHRDVKPANILVRQDGRVKLTDFGIARISSQTVTKTGFTMGTPAYMAPEQILSARVGGRADQFSLAVIAYQMLSGQRPFCRRH